MYKNIDSSGVIPRTHRVVIWSKDRYTSSRYRFFEGDCEDVSNENFRNHQIKIAERCGMATPPKATDA